MAGVEDIQLLRGFKEKRRSMHHHVVVVGALVKAAAAVVVVVTRSVVIQMILQRTIESCRRIWSDSASAGARDAQRQSAGELRAVAVKLHNNNNERPLGPEVPKSTRCRQHHALDEVSLWKRSLLALLTMVNDSQLRAAIENRTSSMHTATTAQLCLLLEISMARWPTTTTTTSQQ